MKNLEQQLKDRKSSVYKKLKSRFLKSLESGGFSGKSGRERYYAINTLKKFERQLGIRSSTKLKHWAIALSLGFITIAATSRFIAATPPAVVPFRSVEIPSESVIKGEDMGVGDFDGDCDTDVLSFVYNGDHTIFFNDGSGNLDVRTIIESSNQKLNEFVIGHFDGDADLDFVISEEYGSTDRLRFFSNQGDGTFVSSQAFYNDTLEINSLQTGDFDNDGVQDLLVLFEEPSTATDYNLLINDGSGNFSYNALSSNLNGHTVLTGDFDSDGDDDILEGSSYLNIVVYRNDSTLNFDQTIPSSITLGPPGGSGFDIKAGDIDSDGDLELIGYFEYVSNPYLYVFDNNGSGIFSSSSNTSPSQQFSDFQVFDYDGDSDIDLLVDYGGSPNDFEIFKNDGVSTGFSANTLDLSSVFNAGFDGTYIADFDGDGDFDILAGGYYELSLFKNNSGSIALFRDDLINPLSMERTAVGDVDGDGDIDIVGNKLSQVLLNDGSGGFTLSQTLARDNGLLSEHVSLGFVNDDAHLDVVFTGRDLDGASRSTAQVGLNDGSGNFILQPLDTLPTQVSKAYASIVGELDGDGDLELFLIAKPYSSYSAKYFDFDNAGNLPTTESGSQFFSSNGDFKDIQLVEADTVSGLDVVVTDADGIHTFRNNGTGSFSDVGGPFIFDGGVDTKQFAAADFDGDGDIDVAIAHAEDDSGITNYGVHPILRNDTSSYVFGYETNITTGQPAQGVVTADFDLDGDFDLFYASNQGSDLVYLNDGAGSFDFSTDTGVNSQSYALNKADFDGDGDIDILSIKGNRKASILLNDYLAAPIFNDTAYVVAENSLNGTVVDTLRATDVNGDALSYTIDAGNTGNTFQIENDSILSVSDSTLLDFESPTTWNLQITASDGSLSDDAVVTITISDINESPIVSDDTFTIDENSANGVTVDTVAATDPESAGLTYSI
ncbi:MAG: VCBS repeat-containing protein, partial [Cyclobacteriaceae bacterium]|nr:VCBS repeat-containing protein [Cyclobacteriaceae bacterium HetDA_MAG_MS6]